MSEEQFKEIEAAAKQLEGLGLSALARAVRKGGGMTNLPRTFKCPKCDWQDIGLHYDIIRSKLECRCRRCDAIWTEEPSDKASPETQSEKK